MKYYYNIMDGNDDRTTYYNSETVRRFRVYPATPRVVKAATDPNSSLWPVHDIYAPIDRMNECVECKDINEAYEYIMLSENQSIYEYIHDI